MDFRTIVKADLITHDFPSTGYIKESVDKKQIVLHHTASGKGVTGDINSWINNPTKIATCVIIGHDGMIHQCFSSKYWGYHLGVSNKQIKATVGLNKSSLDSKHLNMRSIAIEIDSWGYLKKIDGEWRAWPNNFGTTGKKTVIDEKDIQFYPNLFKGHEAYEKYTKEQIQTVKELLLYWHHTYGISVEYNDDVWDLSKRALSGENGTFTHNSYRTDKTDVHPQTDLIEMWEDLTEEIYGAKPKDNGYVKQ